MSSLEVFVWAELQTDTIKQLRRSKMMRNTMSFRSRLTISTKVNRSSSDESFNFSSSGVSLTKFSIAFPLTLVGKNHFSTLEILFRQRMLQSISVYFFADSLLVLNCSYFRQRLFFIFNKDFRILRNLSNRFFIVNDVFTVTCGNLWISLLT